MLVASGEELEEEHGAGAGDRQIPDLVDDHQAGEDERAEPVREPACASSSECSRSASVVKYTRRPCSAAATARLSARCVLPTPGGPSSTTFSVRSMKLSSCRLSICSRLIEGWNEKSKVSS